MKRRWIALGLFLLSALALGFWPLKSKVWTLPKPPAAELLKKQAYLKRLEPASAKAPNSEEDSGKRRAPGRNRRIKKELKLSKGPG